MEEQQENQEKPKQRRLRPHERLQLARELAAAELNQTQLAAKYGVTPSAISYFNRNNATTIAEIRGKIDDEFAGLWAARKVNRIAQYQDYIDKINDAIEGVAKSSVPTAEMIRTAQAGLRAIADELGHIPQKSTVEVSGKLDVTVNGVNVDSLK